MAGQARTIFVLAVAGALLCLSAVRSSQAGSPAYNYALHCLGCHTVDGVSPQLGRIPPLRGVVGHLARTDLSRRYIANVPGIKNSGLNDADTAALLNWLIVTYGGDSQPESWRPFDGAEIAALRADRPADVMALRAAAREELIALGFDIGYYP